MYIRSFLGIDFPSSNTQDIYVHLGFNTLAVYNITICCTSLFHDHQQRAPWGPTSVCEGLDVIR